MKRKYRLCCPESGSGGLQHPAVLALFILALASFLTAFIPPGSRTEADVSSLITVGSDAVVEEGAEVERAVSIGGNVRVLGHVRKDAVSVGGNVYLGADALVEGNAVSIGGHVDREPGSQVNGEVTIVDATGIRAWLSDLPRQGLASGRELWEGIGWVSSLAFFLVALIITAVMPGTIGSISFHMEHHTARCIFWGLLGSALIFPLGFLLFVSILGIVLIPALMILFCCALILGYVAAAQLIGKRITIAIRKPGRHILLELALGYAALFAMGFVPMAGWIIRVSAAFLGFGGVLSTLTIRGRK